MSLLKQEVRAVHEEEEYWDGLEICNKFIVEKERQQELHAQILRSLLCPVTFELRFYYFEPS